MCVFVLDPTCDETVGGAAKMDQEMKGKGNETTKAQQQDDDDDDEEENNR